MRKQSAPAQGYADDIKMGGARYVQWNMALYDDEVLWVVPYSHNRLNTAKENAQLATDDCAPLPGSIQVKLAAGDDAVVYILPLLHWASTYSTRCFGAACPHGGFSEFAHYPVGLQSYYVHLLHPEAHAGDVPPMMGLASAREDHRTDRASSACSLDRRRGLHSGT